MREYLIPISALKPLITELTVSYKEITTSEGGFVLIERLQVKGVGVFERRSWSDRIHKISRGVYFPKYILLETSMDLKLFPQEVQAQAICTKHLDYGDRGYNAAHLDLVQRFS